MKRTSYGTGPSVEKEKTHGVLIRPRMQKHRSPQVRVQMERDKLANALDTQNRHIDQNGLRELVDMTPEEINEHKQQKVQEAIDTVLAGPESRLLTPELMMQRVANLAINLCFDTAERSQEGEVNGTSN